MLFNSVDFLIFFPIVTILYFFIPYKYRWLHLLLASCIFYCAFIPVYILILFFTIIVDYIAGRVIEHAKGKKKKFFLVTSIIANVGILAFFKYYNFFIDNVNMLLNAAHIHTYSLPFLNIILPIGLSFHTFQAMSYTIEVYRGHQKAEKHFGIYALYVMFYPQLVAGPIERPQNMLHQFREKHDFDYDRVTSGLRLMAWGLFKKIVIADRLSILVNNIFDTPSLNSGLPVIVGIIFFSIQIYCDFSGYSDIALGSARVMGFKLMKNFDRPYFSKNMSEFWSRWHISLSTWFRDYVYISLGGNRVVKWRWYFNLLIVFMLSGLWHGANWTFVIWGVLHGIYLIVGNMTKQTQHAINQKTGLSKLPFLEKTIHAGITCILAAFAWIFFRAKSFHDAIVVIKNSFGETKCMYQSEYHYGLNSIKIFYTGLDWILLFISFVILFGAHWVQRDRSPNLIIARQRTAIRWSIYFFFFLLILFGRQTGKTQFIYFQF
ncbi:MAG: rane bound O-acyl transferase family protein [Bacteroidota bacterium]|nr:rane bound O-acyl transferase family protein [Bacteroidota bacterium]